MKKNSRKKRFFPFSPKAFFSFAAAVLLVLFLAGILKSRQVFFYCEKEQPPFSRQAGQGAVIANSYEGLSAWFSLPHQARPGDPYWLYLSFSINAEAEKKGPYTLSIRRLGVRDLTGAIILDGRHSPNPDFARSVYFEKGALTGLRPLSLENVFIAGVPFHMNEAPRKIFLDYEFVLKDAENHEEVLKGTLKLERGSRLSLF